MSPAPLISVIVPVYNRQQAAISAILSVQAQTFEDIEIIVVDDGSTPALQLTDALSADPRLRLVRQTSNKGQSAARNTGAREAKGRWLAWLDSDDLWDPTKLQRQMVVFEELGEIRDRTALATGFTYVLSSGKRDSRIPIGTDDPLMFFSGCWYCPGSTVMLSRAMFEEVGGFDEEFRRLEDLEWFARFVDLGGKLRVVEELLVDVKAGHKAPYDVVRRAGDQLKAKLSKQAESVGRKADRCLSAYLELEYASSALKGDKKPILGMRHLLTSCLLYPRLGLHLHRFWRG